jgi:hypothetical protein
MDLLDVPLRSCCIRGCLRSFQLARDEAGELTSSGTGWY